MNAQIYSIYLYGTWPKIKKNFYEIYIEQQKKNGK